MSSPSSSTFQNESDENEEYFNSTSTDDLEKAIMLAAKDADLHDQDNDIKIEPKKNENQSADKSAEVEKNIKRNKRKHSDDEYEETRSSVPKTNIGIATVVASHYNSIEEKGKEERLKSRIVYMRNFHNWIKSMLINEYLLKIRENRHNQPLRVLDMGCGKGGDLLKWKNGKISQLICTDIAKISLEQCKKRYEDMKERNRDRIFGIELIHADCSRVQLRKKYSDPSLKLDLVSCQFAFHYGFESLPQAECMLKNASECLAPGGYFIGTIPDANDLVSRARKNDSTSFGNDVFQVVFDEEPSTQPNFFGVKYNFYLEKVLDCPEFLVHFPTFVKLAKKFGLKLVRKEKFYDFYYRMRHEGKQLLANMSALEAYPPTPGVSLVGENKEDYQHADYYCKTQDIGSNVRIGTLSKSEWEASSLYLTFAFVKVKNTWNVNGTPCYDFS